MFAFSLQVSTMKITLFTTCVLIFIGNLCHVSNADFSTAKPIQIVTPVNHTFLLELNDFKAILEADEIKDRHVVVVSIAGAFRKGKSFLSNFFIRYLYAQYKVHNVSDWLGENEKTIALNGFKWRGGRKPETIGIWMWSDIFTHDYETGEKVAIILLDTQGIFDSRSSLQDCTTIFALSMMLSSVQCYNVMQNIQENDLQNLELFTEYGRMVLDQTNEKPFQYLLFIIRDWPFAEEYYYGWGQKVIDETLAGEEEQTPEMHQLRQRINSSFEEINAFLLPYPGSVVALKKNFNGDLKQIDPEFLTYVKELVPSIFAPENLVLKKINGEKVRARDLVAYMQAYLNVFNEQTLPEPKTVVWATAEVSNLILFNDAVNLYLERMQKALHHIEPYFSAVELLKIHEINKNQSISQFMQKRKLGNDELISSFVQRIDNATEVQFLNFQQENSEKRKIFIDKANLHNEKLIMEIQMDFEKGILNGIENLESMTSENLKQLLETEKENALEEFNTNKMMYNDIDANISSSFAEELQKNLEDFEATVETMLTSYLDSLNSYSDLMRDELNKVELYATRNSLTEMHQKARKEAIAQFQIRSQGIAAELTSFFQHKMELEIEWKYASFEQENEVKHSDFVKKAKAHNLNLVAQIEKDQRISAYTELDNSDPYLNSDDLNNLWKRTNDTALSQFDANKMGDDEVSHGYRTQLQGLINDLRFTLSSLNEHKKSTNNARNPGSQTETSYSALYKTGGLAAGGAAVGAVIGGPPGAIVGGLFGGFVGYLFT